MPEPARVRKWRERYRRALLDRGPLAQDVLLGLLRREDPPVVSAAQALTWLEEDPILVASAGAVRLGLPPSTRREVERQLVEVLTDSATTLTHSELMEAWRALEPDIARWVPEGDLIEVITGAVRRRALGDYGDAGVGARRPARLPAVAAWRDTGRPFDVSAESVDQGMTLSAEAPDAVAGAVAHLVGQREFRTLRLTPHRVDGPALQVTAAVVELPGQIAVVSAFRLEAAEERGALGEMPWWFWRAGVPRPLDHPYERIVAPVLYDHQPALAIHATVAPRGVGEAVAAALTASRVRGGARWTAEVAVQPAEFARMRRGRGPTLSYCLNPSCGRPLSDPRSAERGYGPCCWARLSPREAQDIENVAARPSPSALESHWDYALSTDEWERLLLEVPNPRREEESASAG